MSKHSEDDRFDAWVQNAARSYNSPPDIVPRDVMWDAIEVRGQRSEVTENRAGRHAQKASRLLAFPLWSLAAAAVLLLATGIGLGRLTMRGDGTPVRNTAAVPTPIHQDTTGPGLPPAESVVANTGPGSAASIRPQADREPGLNSPRSTEGGRDTRAALYDIATVRHLTAAEALLTSFRAAPDTSMDNLMRRWARDLLSTTRLLLDSPAGGDAQRRRLLEDLELVLVQMVRLPAQDSRFDRELIERSISRQQVLTRIRTSIPAGASSGT